MFYNFGSTNFRHNLNVKLQILPSAPQQVIFHVESWSSLLVKIFSSVRANTIQVN